VKPPFAKHEPPEPDRFLDDSEEGLHRLLLQCVAGPADPLANHQPAFHLDGGLRIVDPTLEPPMT
jgi:hypothetical protein